MLCLIPKLLGPRSHASFPALLACAYLVACGTADNAGQPLPDVPDRSVISPVIPTIKHAQPPGVRKVYPLAYRFNTAGPELAVNGETVNCQGYYLPLEGAYPGKFTGPKPSNIGAVIRCQYDNPRVHPVRYEISWRKGFVPAPVESTEPETIWVNVTHDAPNWDLNPLDGIRLDGVSSYNYFAQELNTIRARVTFSDGVVVESRPEDEPVIRLLPGPGWLPPEERLFWTECWVLRDGKFVDRRTGGGLYEGTGSITIGVRFVAGGYNYDCMRSAKYGLKWGMGEGWEDVTSDAADWWQPGAAIPTADNLTLHTFTTPGRHVVESQVRYWDRELLTIDQMDGFNNIYVYLDTPVT